MVSTPHDHDPRQQMVTASNLSRNGSTSSGHLQIPWSSTEKAILAFAYSGLILLASLGNSLVLLVFIAGPLRRPRSSRQSDIRHFLTNLAISDLLISIFCLPFTFTYVLLWNWPFPDLFCPLVLFIQVLSVTASAVTNMMIGLDRFWVVLYPMRSRITRNRSWLLLALVWGGSAVFALPQLVVGNTRSVSGPSVSVTVADNSSSVVQVSQYRECEENWGGALQLSYTLFVLVATYVLPLAVLCVTYSIVGVSLWRRAIPGEANQARDASHLRSKVKVIKMLAIIVTCFGLCWLPLHLFFLLNNIIDFRKFDRYHLNIAYVICHWIAMANSCINPFVYGIMNDSFQEDLRWILREKCCCLFFWLKYKSEDNYGGAVTNCNSSITGANSIKMNRSGSAEELAEKANKKKLGQPLKCDKHGYINVNSSSSVKCRAGSERVLERNQQPRAGFVDAIEPSYEDKTVQMVTQL